MIDLIESVFIRNSLVVAFAVIGVTLWFSYLLADKLTAGRVHGSAIAIALGLLALVAGVAAVVVSFLLVPVISKIGRSKTETQQSGEAP